MRRINTASVSTDLHGSGKHGFKDGVAPGVAPTRLNASWFNHLQEEMARVVEACEPLNPDSYSQLLRALQFADLMRAPYAAATVILDGAVTDDVHAIIAPNVSNMRLLAVGESGLIQKLLNAGTWDAETAGSSYSGTFRHCCYAGGSYGAVAVGDSEEIQTSAGSWTRRNTGATQLNAVATDGTTVVTCGASALIRQSTAVGTWTSRTSAHAGTLKGCAFGAGLFVIGGANGIQSSPDGISWTSRTTTPSDWVEYVTGIGFVSIASSNGRQMVSADGITWVDGGIGSGITGKFMATLAGIVQFGFEPNHGTAFYRGQDMNSMLNTAQVANLWQHAVYSSQHRGIWLVGEAGKVGFYPTPFGMS